MKEKDIYLEYTWAILLPCKPEWLYKWLIENEENGKDINEVSWLYVYEGTKDYCALIKTENDSPDGSSYYIDKFSSAFPKKNIYELIFENEGVYPPVTVYTNSKILETLDESAFEVAAKILGKALPNAPEKQSIDTTAVCVVVDSTIPEVEKFINGNSKLKNEFKTILAGKNVIIYSEKLNTYYFGSDFALGLKKKVVYSIFYGYRSDGVKHFICDIQLDEKTIASFYYPSGQLKNDPEEPSVDNIMGEIEPLKIVQKLGVPLHIIGMG